MRKIYFALILLLVAGCHSSRTLDTDTYTPTLPEPSDNGYVDPSDVDAKPVAVVHAVPEAAEAGETVTLNGTNSFDPAGDEIVKYTWTQLDATQETSVTIADSAAAETTFVAPNVNTTLKFQLVVEDSAGDISDAGIVQVPVTTVIIKPPAKKFIAVSALSGSDQKSGDANNPVATINKGIVLAAQKKIDTVYVMEGAYHETVALADGVSVIGNVSSIDSEGNPSFYETDIKTTITPNWWTQVAVLAKDVAGASIENFQINGLQGDGVKAVAVSISGSDEVKFFNNSFLTIGSEGSICHDIEAIDGSNITFSGNKFINGGNCDDYTAIYIDGSVNAKVTEYNLFIFAAAGKENFYRAVQSVGGSGLEFSNSTVTTENSILDSTSSAVGVAINDTTLVDVTDNKIDLSGGSSLSGVVALCSGESVSIYVGYNEISLDSAATINGAEFNCGQPSGELKVFNNKITLAPKTGQVSVLNGIAFNSLYRPASLKIINNVIAMPVVVDDNGTKTALKLSRLGTGSEVSSIFNTFYVTGNVGELHIVSSDVDNAQFSTNGNIAMVYGANTSNSIFSIKSACAANNCLKSVVANLINSKFYNRDIPLIVYSDTSATVLATYANACESLTPPSECANVSLAFNQIGSILPSYFDSSFGLKSSYTSLVTDKGPLSTGVLGDINDKPRGDLPDIGAVEYK